MMHTLLSILVGLSPVIVLLSVPTFALASWFGARGRAHTASSTPARIGLLVVGCFGFLLDAVAVAFVLFDNPHGRFMDSIDSGPLTGVPTLFVILLSLFTMAVMGGLVVWSFARRRRQNGWR